MEAGTLYIVLAALFGLFMAWGIGANDVANAMATSVGSRVLSLRRAILVAALFEFAGAYLAGGSVTTTIRSGIVAPTHFATEAELLIFGMLAALLAAGSWLLLASARGWPVSTTHTIVGGIIGFAVVAVGAEVVQWGQVATIAASWVVSPLIAGTCAYLLFRSVQRLILDTDDPFTNARRFVPGYMFITGFVISHITLSKGLKHVGLPLSGTEALVIAGLIGLGVMALGIGFIRRIEPLAGADRDFQFTSVERVFAVMMVLTACSMAFAHGSNDVANAIGPVAAVVGLVQSAGSVVGQSAIPGWVLFGGAAGIVAGLTMWGYRVIRTVGRGITELTPSRGFACELSTAATVVFASGVGLPVSTTHTLVGAILGVGLVKGIAALDLGVIRSILLSWLVTLPAGALLAVLYFYLLRALLG